jgi:hypothetical protein
MAAAQRAKVGRPEEAAAVSAVTTPFGATLRCGVVVLALVNAAYSMVVILPLLQGFFPAYCSIGPICGSVRVPSDRIGLLIYGGVSCAIAGNIWWLISWASGALATGYTASSRLLTLQTCARFAWSAFWILAGALFLLPLLFVLLWIAMHLWGLVALIPLLIWMGLK